MAEFDIRMPQGERDTAIPEFYLKPVHSKFRSKQEGRPIYEDVEYVRIILPGNRRDTPEERVTQAHKDRWPQQYARFKAGQEQVVEGTPLEQWSYVGRSQIEELKHFHIRTVEAMAEATDATLQNFMGGTQLREAAKAFLEQAKGIAPITELQDQVRQLMARNEQLENTVADLTRRLEAKDAA